MNETYASFGALHQAVSEQDQSLPSAMGDAIRYGLPAAAISGFASIANTAISLGNVLGADADKIDIGAKIADFDDDMAYYYKQHEKGVDLAGYIGTSLIPGLAGMKALKMAQNGLAGLNASSQLGLIKNTNFALNFFRNGEAKFTAQALEKIRNSTNLAYNAINKEKYLGVAMGYGEQALQGAAFETAVLLTMNQSSVLSQADEGYFTSLVRNSSQILTGAAFNAALGGTFAAFKSTGTLRKAKESQDFFEMQSRKTERVGVQEMGERDPGSWVASEFSYYNNKVKEFDARKAGVGPPLTVVEIRNYENAIANYRAALQERITTLLTPEGKDGILKDGVWKLIQDAPEPVNTMDFLASAAKSFSRASIDNAPPTAGAVKVMTAAGPLVERKAKNLINFVQKNPDTLVPLDESAGVITDQMIFDWGMMNKIAYVTPDGVYHVLDDSKHYYVVRHLPKGTKMSNPTTMVKLQGDRQGQVTEYGYATLGDYGIPTINKNGDLLVDDALWKDLPETFHPIENDSLQSNAQFVKAQILPDAMLGVDNGILSIARGDLPMLERIANKGAPKDTTVLYGGRDVTGNIDEVLKNEKGIWRDKMIQEGIDIKKISRALNVTEDFAERGAGDGYALSKIEDHTLPGYVVVEHQTSRIPQGQYARGIASLMNRVQLGDELNHTVSASLLGRFYTQLVKTEGTLLDMSTVERFSTTLTSHMPDLGGMGMVSMQSGKVAAAAKQEFREAVVNIMNSFDAQVRQNPEARIELNQFINKMRNSTEKTYMLNADDIQELGLPIYTRKAVFIKESLYKKFYEKDADLDAARVAFDKALNEKQAVLLLNEEAEDWAIATHGIVQNRMGKWTQINAARGVEKNYDIKEFILPPINTRKYPEVAFVKEKFQTGVGEPEGVALIVAHTKDEFERKLNKMQELYGDRFDFQTMADKKQWAKIEGEYFEMPFVGKTMADDAIRKEGFHEFIARTDDEFLRDMNQWHWNQEGRIVDQAIELHYAQEFAEIRAIGEEWEKMNAFKYHDTDVKTRATQNPYLRYINTALGVSDFDRYNTVWGKITSTTEKYLGKAFEAWDQARADALAGKLDWRTANDYASRFGFRPMYGDVAATMVNPAINSRELQGMMAKANGLVSTLTIGLDFLNSLVQAISLPVMLTAETQSILKGIKAGDPRVGELQNILHVAVPGSGIQMPTNMKLMSKAVSNIFSADSRRFAQYYEDIGAVTLPSDQYLSVVESSRMTPQAFQSAAGMQSWLGELQESVTKYADIGKKYTGYNWTEWATRFIAADVARQLGTLAGLSADRMPAYINTFVNRVHGNYMAAQRPHIFQGLVGQAISLFQTYQFNIMQNMVRYGQQGDKTAIAAMLGMQNMIFGFQSNPGFYVLNEAIGKSNKEHIDLTSGVKSIIGQDIGDWVLYGLGSNVLQTSLYNRGDLTPRYVTVLPTKLEDLPAVAIPAHAISAFVQTASNIVKGGSVVNSMLDGVSHFGMNRPIAGLAQLVQGQRTSNKGNILAAYNDLNGFAIAAKLAGGEELNRAIAIDAYYRNNAYRQYDREQLQSLGEAVKTRLYRGQQPTQDQVANFMSQYARTSGNPVGFNRFLMNAYKDANESRVNALMRDVNSRYGRAQMLQMGGDEIPDYINQGLNE